MDQMSLLKQMIQFNKTAFDNAFNAMDMLREQQEKAIESFLEQSSDIPAEGKDAIRTWLLTCKTACNDLKSKIDDSYRQFDGVFDSGAGAKTKK